MAMEPKHLQLDAVIGFEGTSPPVYVSKAAGCPLPGSPHVACRNGAEWPYFSPRRPAPDLPPGFDSGHS